MNGFSTLENGAAVDAPVYGYGFYSRRKRGTLFSRRRFKLWLGFFGLRYWPSILLTFIAMGIAVYSVQEAKWISPDPPLLMVLALATLATAIVVRTGLQRGVMISLLVLAGALVTLWQLPRLAGDRSVWQLLSSTPNQGTIYFGFFIIAVTWATGSISTWFVLRKRNAWVPAGLGAVIVLVNLSNLPEEHYKFFPIYIMAALVLVGFNGLINQRVWGAEAERHGKGVFSSLVLMLVVGAIAVSLAWLMPDAGVGRMGIKAGGQLITDIQNNALNVFASVPGKWSVMKNGDLETLSFSSPVDNRDTVLFVVTSEQPAYWRIKRYNDYQSWGWSSSPTAIGDLIKAGTKTSMASALSQRQLTYTVETKSKTDVLLLAGEFVSSSIPVNLQQQGSTSPAGGSADIVSVVTPSLMQPYQRYTVVASVSSATAAQLQAAGTNYPDWVASNYLQLPLGLSLRVRQLAATTTRAATTPYDKAVAVQEYVHGLRYNKDAKSPSRRGDETDSFLFVQKEGVCTDFATAMVVMLRSVGIPARLATGYLPGEHAAGTNTYVVRGKDYHAWPEVYFPGYGWIDFEATPRPGVSPDLTISGSGSSTSEIPPEDLPVPDSGSVPVSGGNPVAVPKPNGILPVVLVVLFLSAAAGLVWMFVNRMYRSLRMSGNAQGVYAKMCRLASLVGVGPVLTETPLEYCSRLAGAFPDGAESISSIGNLYTEARFSPRKDLPPAELVHLQKSWVQLYPVLFKRRLPWRR